jgi:hypothetical protein
MKTNLLLLIALMMTACIGPRRDEPPLPPFLYPGTIITTPEGAYILDILWLGTDEDLPPHPSDL